MKRLLLALCLAISFLTAAPAHAASLPSAATIQMQYLEGVPNQGYTKSCVSWTLNWALSYLYNRKHDTHVLFSPTYTYDWADWGLDLGSNIDIMAQVARTHGVVSWQSFAPGQPMTAWDIRSPSTIPSWVVSGAWHLNIGVHHLWSGPHTDLSRAQLAIARGRPVEIAASIRSSFNEEASSTGYIDPEWGYYLFDHEMLLIGYDNHRHAFLAENWWGQWAGVGRDGIRRSSHNGYVWLSYRFVQTEVSDATVLTLR